MGRMVSLYFDGYDFWRYVCFGGLNMKANDRNLIRQLIAVGKAGAIYDCLPDFWLEEAKEKIKEMGTKWCCHSANSVKRLDVPLPLLSEPRGSKILKAKK